MIHYTLLPEYEEKSLKKEYRIRLTVVLLFALSVSFVIGILILMPSYFLSSTKERQTVSSIEKLKDNRKATGFDSIENELISTANIVSRLTPRAKNIILSRDVAQIIKDRTDEIFINSFDLSYDSNSTSTQAGAKPVSVILQGRATTREALITFSEKLKKDQSFKSIDLPISDLTKSKNISFTLKFTILN